MMPDAMWEYFCPSLLLQKLNFLFIIFPSHSLSLFLPSSQPFVPSPSLSLFIPPFSPFPPLSFVLSPLCLLLSLSLPSSLLPLPHLRHSKFNNRFLLCNVILGSGEHILLLSLTKSGEGERGEREIERENGR
jgi:hypothetical protein